MNSMRAFLHIFFLLVFLVQPFCATAANKNTRRKSDPPKVTRRQINPPKISRKKLEEKERKYRHLHIQIRQKIFSSSVSGRLATPEQVRSSSVVFYQALEELPDSFVKRTGLRYVCFVQGLMLNKKPAGGVASGDTIYLKVNCGAHTIYHELFHIFDPKRENKKWTSLNPKGFLYTGSDFFEIDYTRSKQKQIDANLKRGRFDDDFVSQYAMSFEWEDRAETFAAMMTEGHDFLRRVRKSPVLRQKMQIIIELTEGRKLLGPDFWKKHMRRTSQMGDVK